MKTIYSPLKQQTSYGKAVIQNSLQEIGDLNDHFFNQQQDEKLLLGQGFALELTDNQMLISDENSIQHFSKVNSNNNLQMNYPGNAASTQPYGKFKQGSQQPSKSDLQESNSYQYKPFYKKNSKKYLQSFQTDFYNNTDQSTQLVQ